MHRHGRRGAGPRLHAGAQKPSVFMARPRAVLSQASTTAHRQASLGPRVWVPSLHHHHSEWNTAAGSSRHGPDLSLQHLGKPLTVWPRLAAYSLTLTSHHPRSRKSPALRALSSPGGWVRAEDLKTSLTTRHAHGAFRRSLTLIHRILAPSKQAMPLPTSAQRRVQGNPQGVATENPLS
ncbi:uncharacterized protein LOC144337808 isoform X2 [Macaca mulatta]